MINKAVIKVEHLYKEYRLGVIGHGTLYRDLQSWWARLRGKDDPNTLIGYNQNSDVKDQILALKDINIEINEGEVIGIIGANGAGKSTLLKILSRVTAPTKGTIKVKGRIASLLEVGTGFHPELTGRENIYLNGAINGMDKKEVTRKLEQIASFAGVEKFLDTPVKRYSSGMHVRLGFAVAAHLEPEILVVDEVLAVGDAEFQKKAVSKMQDVSKTQGRTVLFVSHNMDSIKDLCTRCILLNAGSILAEGETTEIINKYIGHQSLDINPEKKWNGLSTTNQPKGVMPGDELVMPIRLRIIDNNGGSCGTFKEIDDICFELECEFLRDARNLNIYLNISNQKNIAVMCMRDNSRDKEGGSIKKGKYLFRTKINGNFLNEGIYNVMLAITEGSRAIHIREPNAVSFLIKDTYNPEGARGAFPNKWPDVVVRPKILWSNTK